MHGKRAGAVAMTTTGGARAAAAAVAVVDRVSAAWATCQAAGTHPADLEAAAAARAAGRVAVHVATSAAVPYVILEAKAMCNGSYARSVHVLTCEQMIQSASTVMCSIRQKHEKKFQCSLATPSRASPYLQGSTQALKMVVNC